MIRTDLTAWHPWHFSWFGRAAICKMTILSKVLYLFRNLPIKIPQSFFKTLHAAQMNFIWAHKHPRVWFALLTQSKARGGMGIPNFRHYYLASHVTRIVDWHCHFKFKDWVGLEEALNPISIRFTPWTPWNSYSKDLKSHALVGITLAIFHNLTKFPKFSSHLSPLTPLQDNPDFPWARGITHFTFQNQTYLC